MTEVADALMADETTDIVFCVNGENIPAHIVQFTFHSPVFKAMLSDVWIPEGENGEKPVIPIDDDRVSAENFKLLLGFLYTGEVNITDDNAFALLNVAKMYDVESLVKRCEELLKRNLNDENVIDVAKRVSIFADSTIFKDAVDFLTKRTNLFLSPEKFIELNADVLLEVVKCEEGNLICRPKIVDGISVLCNKLAGFPESQLFNMLLLWAKNECKIQQKEDNSENVKVILEPFLPWIRFPTMTVEFLTTVVYPWKLLDSDTLLRIIVDAQHVSQGIESNESSFSRLKRGVVCSRH
uniref:BTB domain-containing protein n=1 Tax=Panagrolaimus sp. JU765 TaxID=591449 RepID=A0AC34Q9P6_9BILA